MNKRKAKKIIGALSPVIALIAFILAWYLLAFILDAEILLPPPHRAVEELFVLLGKSEFWLAVGATLLRTLASFVLAFLFAAALSVAAYLLPTLRRGLSPIMIILRATPTMSIILLAIIWLTSDISPILIAFLISFPILYSNFLGALDDVDSELIIMSVQYKVPLVTRIAKLYLPNVAPSALSSAGSALSLTLKILISAEVLAQTRNSMGNFMQLSRIYLNTSELMAWTIVAVVLGFILESCLEFIKYSVTAKWRSKNA